MDHISADRVQMFLSSSQSGKLTSFLMMQEFLDQIALWYFASLQATSRRNNSERVLSLVGSRYKLEETWDQSSQGRICVQGPKIVLILSKWLIITHNLQMRQRQSNPQYLYTKLVFCIPKQPVHDILKLINICTSSIPRSTRSRNTKLQYNIIY